MSDICGHLGSSPLRQFGIAADGGQWGAQLVAGVGHELSDPALTGLPGGQGRIDVIKHPIDCQPEPADFSAGIGIGFGDPHRKRDLTAIQRQISDGACGGGHPGQGGQRAADDQDPGTGGGQ